MSQRSEQRDAYLADVDGIGRGGELSLDPADQVVAGNIADEQVQRIGGLVKAAVAQVMGRQRTIDDVVWLGAGPACFVVTRSRGNSSSSEAWGSWACWPMRIQSPASLPGRAGPCSRKPHGRKRLGSSLLP